MFSSLKLPVSFAFVVAVHLLIAASHIGGGYASAIFPKKFVPQEFVESYRGFCTDVVANEIFLEHSNTYGVTAASTIGIGHLLSVINEGIFAIPRDGFDEALRVQLSAIGFAYRDLIESLLEDPNVHSTSTLYVANKTLQATEQLRDLKTHVFYQDFSQPHIVVPTINSRIAIQTHRRINDKLIPKGGWYGPSIWSFTKGVFINTLHYKSQFAYPFVDVGKGYFVTDKVRMIASAGNFLIKKLPEYTIITLPLQDGRKSLVLILPKEDLNAMAPYLEEALDYTKTDGTEVKPLIVQIPALNFTVSNEYFSQLFYMGINNTMCNWNDGNENFLQPVAQALYFNVDADRFEIAAATGAQLNDNDEFQQTTGIPRRPTAAPSSSPPPPTPTQSYPKNNNIVPDQTDKQEENLNEGEKPSENEAEPSQNPSRFRSAFLDEDDIDAESEEIIDPARHLDLVGDQIHAEKIVFDRPFYWYLKDEVIGPVFTGLVNSFRTYKEQVVAVEEAFDDMYKYQFWSCAPKHLALMEAYNNAIDVQEDEEDIGLADGLEDAEVSYDETELDD